MSETNTTKRAKTTTPSASKMTPPKSASKRSAASRGAEHGKRHEMIAEAAYFRAESNGFMGDPQDHWLEAEQAIDAMLDGHDSAPVEG